MTKHLIRRGVSALGISMAMAVTAYAQPQQLPGPQYQAPQYPSAQPRYQPPQYPSAQPPQNPYGQPQYGRMDRRLTELHQRLGITPAQEAAWTAFAGEMRNAAMPTDRTREARPASVLERLERREQTLETRKVELDRMVGTLRPLYASFSDAQKRAADQLLFRPQRGESGRRG
jgi:protein CpxP